MREVTFILPCAGEGSRLGLLFPKELAPLGPGRVVMDSCLDIIGGASPGKRIVLMDDGRRNATADHIGSRLPEVPLARVRQHRCAADWPDGVLRLGPWLGDVNIVLLPDAAYSAPAHAADLLAALAEDTGFALGVARMDADALSRLGAVTVIQDDTVRFYEDKPSQPERFNAAWGMLAFAGNIGLLGLRVIADATRKLTPARAPVIGAPVTWLDGYRDCGTWDGYLAEIGQRELCA